jgi:transposase InsO family protein
MCAIAGVTRSGYYRYLSNIDEISVKEQRDYADFLLILEAYQYRGYDKGVWGIYMRLLHMGIRMNHKKIRRLMRKYNLHCPIRKENPYRKMARAIKTNAIADNRVKREFKEHGPRKVLLTDITYIPLNKEFCYLSVILDAFTMQVLAYQLSESLEVDFVLETVNQLIRYHGQTLDSDTMIHSDQGCHYTSLRFRELIEDNKLRQSMSRRGNCWDNAPQESFFGHMKDELKIQSVEWTSFEEVSVAIDEWMDYYNNDRYQMGLQKMSPNEYYKYITQGIYPASMPRMEERSKKFPPCP